MHTDYESRFVRSLERLDLVPPGDVESGLRAALAIREEKIHADVRTVLVGREQLSPEDADRVMANMGAIAVYCPICLARFEAAGWASSLTCPNDGIAVQPTLAPDALPPPRPKRKPRKKVALTELKGDAWVGHQIAGFEIVSTFDDDDPYCRIFRATQIGGDLPLILKLLKRDDHESRKRFLRSGRYASLIIHPNVVSVVGWGHHEGNPWVVTEDTGGRTMEKALATAAAGRLNPKLVVRICRGVLKGLDAAHRIGVIHRNIKPGTIEIDDNSVPVVTGFDKARIIDTNLETEALTSRGSSLGTPHYMPPEQIATSKVDHRADLYSLGSTVFHMLAGRPPYTDKVMIKLIRAKIETDAPALCSLVPSASPALGEFVDSLLMRNPDGRYPTASHALVALSAVPEMQS